MALAFCFPGQGSQAVGMGKALADAFAPAREVFAAVDEALGENLSALMWDGPEETLRQTQNAQPALMAASMAAVEALRQEFGVEPEAADYLAGHSLGEATALCAAGAIPLEDCARLLRRRGEAMAAACPPGEGAMAALIGADYETANRACSAGSNMGVCDLANDNAPGQIVISGGRLAIERAVEAAQSLGVKRAILLPVSGPFHSALMQSAAADLQGALSQITFKEPSRPIVCNVTARPETKPETLKSLLVDQMTARVRWRESVAWMAGQGVTETWEVGAGKALTGMIRRIDDHIADLARLLRDLRIAEDTLVVFSSDNGPHTESYLKGARYRADLFQAYGPFDGIKRDTLEGGIRVPGLAWWPGTIPAGRVVEGHSQFHDWLNTFLDAAGAPLQAQSDGVSLLPSLTGEGTQETPTTYVEYQVGGRTPDYRDFAPKHRRAMRGQMQAVFLEGYKGLRRNIQGSDDDFQIFDLSADPSERRDLAESSPKFRDLQQQMKDRVLRLRRPNRSAPRPYDGAPMPALPGRTTEAGVDFAFLAGEFPWVPVIGTGQGTRGEADGFEIEIPAAGAVEVSGYLEVPEDGEYAFKLTAPDAAVLHVHQALVVDGDTPGEDGGTLTATARLEAGLHPFRLRYLSAGGNATLAVDGPAKVGFRR